MTVATTFHQRDLVSIDDLSKDEIAHILEITTHFKTTPQPDLLRNFLLATCFFEPSTRTRLSFEAAMLRLGGQVIGFSETSSTSMKKGESLYDAMKTVEQYADAIVIRHPLEGSAQWAADAVDIPVINAGDGAHQHPTQTLLDLFTIQECQGRLENLSIAMAGDLRYGRTVHSLAEACAHYSARLYFIAPSALEMPEQLCDKLRKAGVKFSFHRQIEEVIGKADVLYMTRIQKERFADRSDYERLKNSFRVTPELLMDAQPHMRVLHPLPRLREIPREIDETPYAYYFQQARNGLFVRQALLAMLLGKV